MGEREMKEKEARDLRNKGGETAHFYYANGYLEAMKKAEGLVEALGRIKEDHVHSREGCVPCEACDCASDEAEEALAKWEQEK